MIIIAGCPGVVFRFCFIIIVIVGGSVASQRFVAGITFPTCDINCHTVAIVCLSAG